MRGSCVVCDLSVMQQGSVRLIVRPQCLGPVLSRFGGGEPACPLRLPCSGAGSFESLSLGSLAWDETEWARRRGLGHPGLLEMDYISWGVCR